MKAFMAEMNENWNERQRGLKEKEKREENVALYSVENMKKDYRLKKQRLHVELWLKEIEKLEDAKLADSDISVGDDIQRLIDSCSEMERWTLWVAVKISCDVCYSAVQSSG
ncbi:hypothetical protein VIGAN_05229300 [Vigna angularis var. angularis]|uniref:Uncharacterized protein n=1 Tax=Vigna angularis var. angularis TaxID=157739 RepID=A0A0S3S798_PHAAN|nr:hypothetical protein VIGAN_05229300 [Vigna angularis var. angularis]